MFTDDQKETLETVFHGCFLRQKDYCDGTMVLTAPIGYQIKWDWLENDYREHGNGKDFKEFMHWLLQDEGIDDYLEYEYPDCDVDIESECCEFIRHEQGHSDIEVWQMPCDDGTVKEVMLKSNNDGNYIRMDTKQSLFQVYFDEFFLGWKYGSI